MAASPIGAGSAVAGNWVGPPVLTPAEPLFMRSAGTHSRATGGVSRECVASRIEPISWIFSSSVIWARTRWARWSADRCGSSHGAGAPLHSGGGPSRCAAAGGASVTTHRQATVRPTTERHDARMSTAPGRKNRACQVPR
ncbi:MAG: hypothetical protein AUI10_11890 [Actinobacteria bacterium 13_2_20CM_2_72_6]|nr:MAG: hypothetical protein AUI10_11890 [Actinobacteria bacterium 13_2_20CM_2_72_6]